MSSANRQHFISFTPFEQPLPAPHQSSERSGWRDPHEQHSLHTDHPAQEISEPPLDATEDGADSKQDHDSAASWTEPTPEGSPHNTAGTPNEGAGTPRGWEESTPHPTLEPPSSDSAGALAPVSYPPYHPPGSPFSQQHSSQPQHAHHPSGSASSSRPPSNAASPAHHNAVYPQSVTYHLPPQHQQPYHVHHAPSTAYTSYYPAPISHAQALHAQSGAPRSSYSSPHLHPSYPGSPSHSYGAYPTHFASNSTGQIPPAPYQYIAYPLSQGYRLSLGGPGGSSHPSPSIQDMDSVERHSPLSYDPESGASSLPASMGAHDEGGSKLRTKKSKKALAALQDSIHHQTDPHDGMIKGESEYGPYDPMPGPGDLELSNELDQDLEHDHQLSGGKMGGKRKRTSDSTAPKEKKHICPECSRGFARAYNLKTHVQTHSPDPPKPHVCHYESCGNKAFSRSHDLLRHKGSVHGEGRTAKGYSEPGRSNGKRKKAESLRRQGVDVDYERLASGGAGSGGLDGIDSSGSIEGEVMDDGSVDQQEMGSVHHMGQPGPGVSDSRIAQMHHLHRTHHSHPGLMNASLVVGLGASVGHHPESLDASELNGYESLNPTDHDQAAYQQQMQIDLSLQLEEHRQRELEEQRARMEEAEAAVYAGVQAEAQRLDISHVVDPQLESESQSLDESAGLEGEGEEAKEGELVSLIPSPSPSSLLPAASEATAEDLASDSLDQLDEDEHKEDNTEQDEVGVKDLEIENVEIDAEVE